MPVSDATSFVILPDTQYYACAYPEIFDAQAQWIVDNRDPLGIAVVLHTGDIVDSNVEEQWEVAAQSLHLLDGLVPYLLTSGNHDLTTRRESLIGDYFDPSDLHWEGWSFASRTDGRPDNSYALVRFAHARWLFIGLEFAPRDAVLEWASELLQEHSDRPAVLFTHAYLYSDGSRYDRAKEPPQDYHPDGYAVTPQEGINDGEDIWQRLVEPHENVRLVVSGHVIPDGTARSVATRASGTRVHQVLANYQTCGQCPCEEVEGGGGYLRLLRFADEGQTLRVSTYSPYRDDSLTDDENEFVLNLEPPP